MNTYTDKLINDEKINQLAQQLLDGYRELLAKSSYGGKATTLGENATYSIRIEGDSLEKLVIYFDVDDYYKYIEFGVNGIGYKAGDRYKQEVVSNGLFSFQDNGKHIPVKPLEKWITKKNVKIPSINGKIPTTTQYAYMLSYSIKKHGIEPRHLMDENLETNNAILEAIKLRILEIFNEEMNEELNKININ